ncbi:hypothetical protein HY256_05660, partial [Candidatus Sumerlaeota bacterium]|nr:hypothetical protein [Candidatus Sumerlaeota bacterium]
MTPIQTGTVGGSQGKSGAPPQAARFFHTGAAFLLIGFVIWGFHHFYLQGRAYPGRELTPPIRTLLIFHGFAMSGWLLLMLVQPLLIVSGNRRVHMTLGKVGAVLAGLIVILGLRLAVQSTRVSPPD